MLALEDRVAEAELRTDSGELWCRLGLVTPLQYHTMLGPIPLPSPSSWLPGEVTEAQGWEKVLGRLTLSGLGLS